MQDRQKIKKRGFVMTGGGAKGLYEAGVIHAFHLTGMEFDVITGSSIGAMNAIVYAEYMLRKRGLPAEVRADPERVLEAMDSFVKAFHYAWLRLEHLNLIDDGEGSALAGLKEDLAQFHLDLPLLTRFFWWYTTPESTRRSFPISDLIRMVKEVVERVGVDGLVKIVQQVRSGSALKEAVLRTYLGRLNLEKALIMPGSEAEKQMWQTFTREELILKADHLTETYRPLEVEAGPRVALLDMKRTLADFEAAGIEVRLTRANYRTGRLENSAYYTPEEFVAYLENHAWRFQAAPQETPPLGSHRIQVPGDPSAIGAALASGRFPGVFAPFPITDIYDLDRPQNVLLRRILKNWLDDEEVEAQLFEAYCRLHPNEDGAGPKWERLYKNWRDSQRLRQFFPRLEDHYVDGGAIDNTPSNSGVDAIREWIDRMGLSKREVVLDLYVVLLHPEPMLAMQDVREPALFQTVSRTLEIQGAAKLSSDANVVQTINTFGQRGEELGLALKVLLDSLQRAAGEDGNGWKDQVEAHLWQQAGGLGLPRRVLGEGSPGILERMEAWAGEMIAKRLPLHVEALKIYPEKMAMSTLQFTQRLGYRKQNAIAMITMGCYNALWALRSNFEARERMLDEHDRQALQLARKWMGIERWPEEDTELVQLRSTWQCQRIECVFHPNHCPHGAKGLV